MYNNPVITSVFVTNQINIRGIDGLNSGSEISFVYVVILEKIILGTAQRQRIEKMNTVSGIVPIYRYWRGTTKRDAPAKMVVSTRNVVRLNG
jgi:hypothetical protein